MTAYQTKVLSATFGKRSAFSLIEILVVIGIISILTSLLMPALSKSRRSAMAIQCESNLRQLGIALNIYADQHEGNFPTWSGFESYPNGVSPEDNPDLLGWTEQIMPNFVPPDNPIYKCPEFPAEAQIDYFLDCRWLFVHSPPLRCLHRSDIKLSSQFILGGDCTCREFYPPPYGIDQTHPTATDCDKTDESIKALVFKGEPGGLNMHPGGNNVLFADQHVETFPAFDPQKMTYSPHLMQTWEKCTAE
jgi:prepilin-type N-terminal cleavage/methylation domain-containing protein/prepilin-type processing-associated H-X9-DG protein